MHTELQSIREVIWSIMVIHKIYFIISMWSFEQIVMNVRLQVGKGVKSSG